MQNRIYHICIIRMLKVRTLCEILDLICLHECVGGLHWPRIFTDNELLCSLSIFYRNNFPSLYQQQARLLMVKILISLSNKHTTITAQNKVWIAVARNTQHVSTLRLLTFWTRSFVLSKICNRNERNENLTKAED